MKKIKKTKQKEQKELQGKWKEKIAVILFGI